MAYAKGFTQRAKTIWNHGTHIQNVLGQAMGTLGQGAFPTIKSFTGTARLIAKDLATKTDKEQQEYLEKLAGYNILNKGPIAREINALMKDVRDNGIKHPFAFITERVRRNKLLKSASEKVKKSIDGITDIYIAEDDFFKIVLYEAELKNLRKFNDALPDNYNGFYKFTSEEALEREAARRVVGGLPNYDIVPENLKLWRANPFFSQFFSFLSESTRIGFTTGIQAARELKLGKDLIEEGLDEAGLIMLKRGRNRMAAYTTLGTGGEVVKYGLKYGVPGGGAVVGYQAINRYISGIDEQQEKDIKSFVAPYARNDNLVITINDEGTPIIFNTSRYDFYDYPNKMVSFIPKLIEEGYDVEGNVNQLFFDYAQDMLTPFFGTTMTTSTLTDYIVRGGRNSEGRPMRNPYDKSQVYDTVTGPLDPSNLTVFITNLVENFQPGTGTSILRYVQNYGKDETKFDQEIHKGKEALKFLTGIGSTVLNKEYMTNVYEMNTNSYSRDLSARRGLLANAASNAESKEDFIENYKDIQARHYETYREFYNHTSAARRLGLNTYPVLKDKLSKPEAKYLMGGNRFAPIKITSGILERLVNNQNLASDYFEIKRALSAEETKFSSLPILDYSEKDLEKDRLTKSTGGLITGTEDVPFTEENPADRINPVTGEPYSETSQGVLATLKTRQEDRVPKTYGGLLKNLQKRKKFVAGGIRAGLKFLLKNIAEGKEVPAEELINALPNKVYRGGTNRIVDSPEGTESVFAASDKFHAQTYAAPDAPAKVVASDGKSLDIPKSEYDLHEIDISSAQKPYILNNPTPNMKLKMRTKLAELNDINFNPTPETDDLSDALGVLLGRAEGSLKVDSGEFAKIARAAGKFLREEGFDLIIDTPTLRKGYMNSPDAELYVLKNFPVKAIDDFVPTKVKEQVEEATENVAKKIDEPPTVKVPTWFKETKVKTDVSPADAQKTQVGITSGTYKKVVPLLKEGNTLDFGAGLGQGAKILNADSYEPFPKKEFTPTVEDTTVLDNFSYDNIVSLNVLNVVPPDTRKDIVLEIGRLLKNNGKAIITTRGSDIFGNKNNITKGVLSKLEDGAIITSSGTYQKGFTNLELKEYVSGILGEGYEVTTLKGLGKAGVQIEKGIFAKHATKADFDKFDLNYMGTGEGAQVFSDGIYFAESDEVISFYKKSFDKDLARTKTVVSKYDDDVIDTFNLNSQVNVSDTRKQFFSEISPISERVNDALKAIKKLQKYGILDEDYNAKIAPSRTPFVQRLDTKLNKLEKNLKKDFKLKDENLRPLLANIQAYKEGDSKFTPQEIFRTIISRLIESEDYYTLYGQRANGLFNDLSSSLSMAGNKTLIPNAINDASRANGYGKLIFDTSPDTFFMLRKYSNDPVITRLVIEQKLQVYENRQLFSKLGIAPPENLGANLRLKEYVASLKNENVDTIDFKEIYNAAQTLGEGRLFLTRRDYIRMLKELEEIRPKLINETRQDKVAKILEVYIKAKDENLIDWDKAISQQSEEVQESIDKLFFNLMYKLEGNPLSKSAEARSELRQLREIIRDYEKEFTDVEDLIDYYNFGITQDFPALSNSYIDLYKLKFEQDIAKYGVKGVKYLDGVSRGQGRGTYNYVVYDTDIINISKKYGVALPFAAAYFAQQEQIKPNVEDDL